MKEHDIRVKLKARVEAWGGEVRAVKWIGRKNATDVLVFFASMPLNTPTHFPYINGGHIFIETKRPGKDATEAQAREHDRMRKAGCEVWVITSEQELDEWLPAP